MLLTSGMKVRAAVGEAGHRCVEKQLFSASCELAAVDLFRTGNIIPLSLNQEVKYARALLVI